MPRPANGVLLGLDVRRAANGAEALKILEGEWFPVILTDWQMPVMDGIELTERVRARGRQRHGGHHADHSR
jgi:CheY-like chemotaxis protein